VVFFACLIEVHVGIHAGIFFDVHVVEATVDTDTMSGDKWRHDEVTYFLQHISRYRDIVMMVTQ
jgi:hypothetical protein